MSGQAPFMSPAASDCRKKYHYWKQIIGFRAGRTASADPARAALRVLKESENYHCGGVRKYAEEKGKRNYQLQ